MRYRQRSSYRRRSRPASTNRLQHSPSTIGSAPTLNTGTIVLAVVPRQDAGSSATSSRTDTADRDRTVAVGSRVGKITFNLGIRGLAGTGYAEYVIFKAQRQFGTPTKGTDPIPSDADCASIGCQQAYRMNMPGWIWKFGQIPLTAETSTTRTVTVSPGKFKESRIRDGDYIGIYLFNRTGASFTHDIQMRYYEYM